MNWIVFGTLNSCVRAWYREHIVNFTKASKGHATANTAISIRPFMGCIHSCRPSSSSFRTWKFWINYILQDLASVLLLFRLNKFLCFRKLPTQTTLRLDFQHFWTSECSSIEAISPPHSMSTDSFSLARYWSLPIFHLDDRFEFSLCKLACGAYIEHFRMLDGFNPCNSPLSWPVSVSLRSLLFEGVLWNNMLLCVQSGGLLGLSRDHQI